jgi:hypothetical protein
VESKQESSQGKGNGTHVLGSRMVDKVMNARKSGVEGRETKPKSRGLINTNERSNVGRIMSKSSLDMKLEHVVCFTCWKLNKSKT